MNAKKIMGAVLVALLAAALFIGAGAAATEGDQGTYFAYQTNTGLTNGVWQNGANTVTVSGNSNVSDVTVAGTYTLGKMTAYFTKPTATYSAVGKYNGKEYHLSNLAQQLLNRKSQVQGTLHFSYKGETISDLRNRLEKENLYLE